MLSKVAENQRSSHNLQPPRLKSFVVTKGLTTSSSATTLASGLRSIQYCCAIHIRLKRNNVFVNLTNLKGQTLIKFSSGLVQKTKNKKQLKATAKFIIEKISHFAKVNFDCTQIIIKAPSTKSSSYLKEFRRRRLDVVYLKSQIPIVHNGCRPPKKRRL